MDEEEDNIEDIVDERVQSCEADVRPFFNDYILFSIMYTT
jgi:hypothetical protein